MELIVGTLAVWRVTCLLHEEEGPARLLERLRRRLGDSVVGRALGCVYCLSVWVAAPVSVYLRWNRPPWTDMLLWCAALSGGAILLERCARGVEGRPARVVYSEAKEEDV